MVRCVICGGERQAYKDCAGCAEKRAAGIIPPEMTAAERKAARRAGVVSLATSDAFSEATRQHVAKHLYDQAAKFPAGRPHGALDDRTKYIIELIQANPGVGKPSGIWKLATDVERRGERKSFLKRAGEQLKK
jgi:hypothetical protein